MTKEEALEEAITLFQNKYEGFWIIDDDDVRDFGRSLGMGEQADREILPVINGLKEYCVGSEDKVG